MISLSKRQRFEYVLEADRRTKGSDPPTFELQPLSMRTVAEIEDIVAMSRTSDGEAGYPIGTVNRKVLRDGLVGWRNVKDPANGADIPFAKDADGCIKDELLVLFSTRERTELASQLWGAAHVSGDDAKN